jgi:phosphoglycolate phosphatase
VVLSFGYARGPVAALGADRVIDDFADLDEALGFGGPPPALRALLPRFREEIAADLDALAALATAGKPDALAERAHAARGKAAMFGAERLAAPLGRLETAAADEVPALLAEIGARLAAGDLFSPRG